MINTRNRIWSVCMLLAALVPSAMVSAETADKAQEFYSPEYAGSGSFVTSYSSPQADSVNPAASALTQRVTLDLSYFALAGDNGAVSGLKGSAVNAEYFGGFGTNPTGYFE